MLRLIKHVCYDFIKVFNHRLVSSREWGITTDSGAIQAQISQWSKQSLPLYCPNNMLYFYIYPKMLLPRVQILKSDVVLQLADIENIFLFYFMI